MAERLAGMLKQADPNRLQPWTVLDRQLVERALEEHHLPLQLAKKMPEDKRSYVDDVLDDLFGLRPPSWVLVPQVAETMQRLARTGHVILIGRGATIVTSQLPNVFHVRLVASLPTRISRIQASRSLTAEEALSFVAKEDRGESGMSGLIFMPTSMMSCFTIWWSIRIVFILRMRRGLSPRVQSDVLVAAERQNSTQTRALKSDRQ